MTKRNSSKSVSLHTVDIEGDFRRGKGAIWMLIGLVGAGKTTFAQKLWAADPKGTVRSSLDEIIQMMSFYHYEPRMSSFYGGIERSTIIEGLLDGYRVIIDRTNITKKIRKKFITLVNDLRSIARDFLGLLSGLESRDFFEHCERNLIEHILLDESKKHVSIYTSFLKLIRDWKARSSQPSLFGGNDSPVKKHLDSIMQIEIVGVFFAIPRKVCVQRRTDDPRNPLRDTVRKVDWKAVIRRMAKQLEPPHLDEGFDRLYTIDEEGMAHRLS